MPTVEVTERGFGQAHDLRLGDEIVLRLPENPTTGFRWQIVSSGDGALQTVDDSFEPSSASAPPGSAGHRVFRFAALRRGTVHLALANKRAWELGGGMRAQVTVIVR